MKIRELLKIVPLLRSIEVMSNFYYLHKKFRANKKYKLKHMLRSGLNVVKNDSIVKHDGNYIINSFFPPLNSKAFRTIAEGVPGEGAMFYTNYMKGIRKAPVTTYVEVTKKCSNNQGDCSTSDRLKEEDLSTQDIIKIVNELKRLGVGIIGFVGDEPLMRQDLESIISTVAKETMTLVFSNGYGLTQERAKALKEAGLFGIAIHIDSIETHVDDAKRDYTGTHKIAIEAIANAKEAGLYTIAQVVCTKELLHNRDIHRMAKYLHKQGIHELRVVEFKPNKTVRDASEQTFTAREKRELVLLHTLYNEHRDFPKTSVFSYIETLAQYGCGVGICHNTIDYQGNFKACHGSYQRYGNIFEESIESIWEKM